MSTSTLTQLGSILTRFAFVMLFAAMIFNTGCKKPEKTAEEKAAEEAAVIKKAFEHFEKGVKLASEKKYDDAIKEYDESIKLNPKSAEAESNLGFAYFDRFIANKKSADLEQSYIHQKKAIAINNGYALAYYGAAQALERAGNLPAALEAWKQYVKLSDPKDAWTINAQKHISAIEKALKKGAGKQMKKSSATSKSPH